MELFVSEQIIDNQAEISDQEFHHCCKVLRNGVGDSVLVTAFDGIIYSGPIHSITSDNAIIGPLTIFKKASEKVHIHLVVSLLHNSDRFEWLIEKATEAGVQEISPVVSRRCQKKHLRMDRLEKIILSSAKQCHCTSLPILHELRNLETVLKETSIISGQKMIAHCNTGSDVLITKKYTGAKDVIICIGPEGDFTDEEIKMAEQLHFTSVNLGPARFRTETAAIVACLLIQQSHW